MGPAGVGSLQSAHGFALPFVLDREDNAQLAMRRHGVTRPLLREFKAFGDFDGGQSGL